MIPMSVFPSASPSNGAIPEWSCRDESEQPRRSTNYFATYVVGHTPIQINIVARAAHAVLESLRQRPSQSKPVCGLGKVADRNGVPKPDQPEVGQPGLVLAVNEDINLQMLRNMSTQR
jgi:hypothetical protein